MTLHERVHAIVVPARVAKLHDMPMTSRERREKVLEPFEVDRPARRKLIEHRPET